MQDSMNISDEAIDQLRVALIDSMLCMLPFKYALAAVNMSEEAYRHIKKDPELV